MATDKLYERVARPLTRQIEQGRCRPGDRLPGVRRLARQFRVSISTTVQVHRLLEDDGRIRACPRSGWQVGAQPWPRPVPTPDFLLTRATVEGKIKAVTNAFARDEARANGDRKRPQ